MPAGLRPFHDDGVRQVAVALVPEAGDGGRRLFGGNDGGDLGAAALNQLRERAGQAGTGDDQVHLLPYRSQDQLLVVVGRRQEVDADDAAGSQLPGLSDLLLQASDVGRVVVGSEIRLHKAGLRAGDDADAAGVGNGSCQPRHGDADAHAALDDGDRDFDIANSKRGQFH